MRKSILFAITLLISAQSTAEAVPLKDCSQGTPKKRITCLQENIILLNSSNETAMAELRTAITGLTSKVDNLTTVVDTLKGQSPTLDSVVIQWFDHPTSCVTYMGNNLLQVVDTCVDPNRNRFMVRPFHQ